MLATLGVASTTLGILLLQFTNEEVSIIILLQEQFVIINRWFWRPENISTPLRGERLHPGFVPQLNLIFRARMHTT